MIQRGIQVRFHEPPAGPAAKWPFTEIYSIYTASKQAGLLLTGIDGPPRALHPHPMLHSNRE